MAFVHDPKQKKDPNGIKTRLSQHDEERLEVYLAQTGQQAAVVAREALIERLDRAGIPYAKESLNQEMKQRLLVIQLADHIKAGDESLEGFQFQTANH